MIFSRMPLFSISKHRNVYKTSHILQTTTQSSRTPQQILPYHLVHDTPVYLASAVSGRATAATENRETEAKYS